MSVFYIQGAIIYFMGRPLQLVLLVLEYGVPGM